MEERKKDHIDLALNSRTLPDSRDGRFLYEPLLSGHPDGEDKEFEFLGKKMKTPIWISSMTGGTKMAGTINRNLARACREFGLGMGLGSCRIIMDDKSYFEDFNLRELIGDSSPFFANLGIAQVEELLARGEDRRIGELIEKLQADGLVIHVNPVQEFCQPEGDRFKRAPVETIGELLSRVKYPLVVKEVGQGMGPESLKALLKLPLGAIEFGAFGGTNFSLVELKRTDPAVLENYRPLTRVGHTAEEMLDTVNGIAREEKELRCRNLIISGGIKSFLQGFYLISRSRLPAIYGMAGPFLEHARKDYESLREYLDYQVRGLRFARAYLTPKADRP